MPSILPTVLERWSQGSAVGYDIFSRLLKDRIIFVGGDEGEVTTDSANLLISQLLYLDGEDREKDIHLYINSPGGMVSAGLAVYDTMQFIHAPISTLCMGMAMSFGAVLLASGAKGKRHILSNARVMIHQPLIGRGRAAASPRSSPFTAARPTRRSTRTASGISTSPRRRPWRTGSSTRSSPRASRERAPGRLRSPRTPAAAGGARRRRLPSHGPAPLRRAP